MIKSSLILLVYGGSGKSVKRVHITKTYTEMKDYGKKAIRLLKAMTLIVVLSFGINSTAKAQAAPLAVTNWTPCTVYVSATVMNPACVNVCMTAVIAIGPGATMFLPPCSGPADSWALISYGLCPTFPIGCPMGIDSSPFVTCPPGTTSITSCPAYGSVPFVPVWLGPNAVRIQ